MAVVEDLVWRLGLTTEGSRKELARVDNQMQRFGRRSRREIGRVNKGFVLLGRTIKTNIAGVLALGGGVSLAGLKVLTDDMAKLADTSDKLGQSVEALQEYRFAALQIGVSTQTLEMGLQRFARRVAEAQVGTGELRDTLVQYDIALRNTDGTARSVEEVMRDYADAIKNADTEQERLRLAFKGFDSEGAALVNMFRDGAAGLDAYAARARELGVVIEDDLVRATKEFDKQLDTLILQIETNFKGAILEFLETINLVGSESDKVSKQIENLEYNIALLEDVMASYTDKTSKGAQQTAQFLAEMRKELERLIALQQGLESPVAEQSVPAMPLPPSTKSSNAVEGMRQRVEQMHRLVEAYRKGNAAVAEANRLTAIENNLRRAGVEVTGELADEVRELTEEEIRLKEELEQLENSVLAFEEVGLSAFDTVGDAIADMAIEGEFAMGSFRDVALDVVKDIQREFIKLALLNPIKNALFGTNEGTLAGGLIGGLFGGGGGDIAGNDIGQTGWPFVLSGRQRGGRVNAGTPYVVGERRPEVFIPDTPGRIDPMPGGAGIPGGNAFTMNVGLGVQEAVAAELSNQMPHIVGAVMSAQAQATARAAPLARRGAR